MNTELDPIIAGKLDDFRTRRRNLILLRGLCSGVLSFLGTFVLIALLDYLSEGRMSETLKELAFSRWLLLGFSPYLEDLPRSSTTTSECKKTRPTP